MKAGKRTIEEYYTCISVYKSRREEFRKMYDVKSNEYKKRVFQINKKIAIWGKAIKRIKERDLIIRDANKKIISFLGIDLRNSVEKNPSIEKSLAINIFCKHLLENKMRGDYIALFLGYKDLSMPSRRRLDFTRTFTTNTYNKEMWQRWKLSLQGVYENKEPVKLFYNYMALPGIKEIPVSVPLKSKIVSSVLNYYNIDWADIDQVSRKSELVKIRQIIMYFLKRYTSMPLNKIANLFTQKFDHTTVIYSSNTVQNLYDTGYITTDINNIINIIER